MTEFIPWNSRPLSEWGEKFAHGHFISLNGRSTHYVEKGAGKPVILVHGFNMDMNTWMYNLDPLAEFYKAYAVDLWGLGFSTRDSLDHGYPLFTDQLLLFMDQLGIEKASLVGHSMGGGTSINFSLHHTNRVDKLVLVDATGVPSAIPLRSKIFNLPGLGELLMGINSNYIRRKNLEDYWVFDKNRITDSVFEQVTKFQKIEGTTEILLSILRKEFFNTLGHEIQALGKMNLPILILGGRHEKVINLHKIQEMHQLLLGSHLEIIEKAGHMPNFDKPDQFNKLVLEFLIHQ